MLELIPFLDYTSLGSLDTPETIVKLCKTAISVREEVNLTVAAVCVYPPFIRTAREALEGTGIKVATVAGNFPSGMSSLEQKVSETQSAIKQGAEEIDLVISRWMLSNGYLEMLESEIKSVKAACNGLPLKVILETGELSLEQVQIGSEIAIASGADFLKTSTGKIAEGATIEKFQVMAHAIRRSGKAVGLKASGGIRSVTDALPYLEVAKTLFENSLSPINFRIGASQLLSEILKKSGSGPSLTY